MVRLDETRIQPLDVKDDAVCPRVDPGKMCTVELSVG